MNLCSKSYYTLLSICRKVIKIQNTMDFIGIVQYDAIIIRTKRRPVYIRNESRSIKKKLYYNYKVNKTI